MSPLSTWTNFSTSSPPSEASLPRICAQRQPPNKKPSKKKKKLGNLVTGIGQLLYGSHRTHRSEGRGEERRAGKGDRAGAAGGRHGEHEGIQGMHRVGSEFERVDHNSQAVGGRDSRQALFLCDLFTSCHYIPRTKRRTSSPSISLSRVPLSLSRAPHRPLQPLALQLPQSISVATPGDIQLLVKQLPGVRRL